MLHGNGPIVVSNSQTHQVCQNCVLFYSSFDILVESSGSQLSSSSLPIRYMLPLRVVMKYWRAFLTLGYFQIGSTTSVADVGKESVFPSTFDIRPQSMASVSLDMSIQSN